MMDFKELKNLVRAFWHSKAILTAIELDIFTKVEKGINKVEDLSKECKASLRGIELLCNYLVSIGLLESKNGKLKITKDSLILSSKNKENKLGWFYHQINLWEKWNNLKKAIKSGKEVKGRFDLKNFVLAMKEGKEMNLEKIKDLPIEDGSKILDLGGGPGFYSVLFLNAFKNSMVYLFDLKEVIELNKKILPAEILKNKRFKMISGNFLKDSIGSNYDVIWISSVIHSYGIKDIKKLFLKSKKALNKNGKIFILDFFLNDDKKGPVFPALFALNMLLNTKEGRTYSFKEIEEILSSVGFKNFKRVFISEESSLIISSSGD